MSPRFIPEATPLDERESVNAEIETAVPIEEAVPIDDASGISDSAVPVDDVTQFQKFVSSYDIPATSEGVSEIYQGIKELGASRSITDTIKRDLASGFEVAHAVASPILDFLNPIPGLTGIASWGAGVANKDPNRFDVAAKAVEDNKKFWGKLIGTDRKYISPEGNIVKGMMTAGFGAFDDMGKAAGNFLLEKTGNEALATGVHTVIALLPIAFGAGKNRTKTIDVEGKKIPVQEHELVYGSKEWEAVKEQAELDTALERYAKKNLWKTKSELINAFKKAFKEKDEAKMQILRDFQERITFIYDKAGEIPENMKGDRFFPPALIDEVTVKPNITTPTETAIPVAEAAKVSVKEVKKAEPAKTVVTELAKDESAKYAEEAKEAGVIFNGMQERPGKEPAPMFSADIDGVKTTFMLSEGETLKQGIERKFAEKANFEKNKETPSETIERYRQMDLADPKRKNTKEQDVELLSAVKARKEELKEIMAKNDVRKQALELKGPIGSERGSFSTRKVGSDAKFGTKEFTKSMIEDGKKRYEDAVKEIEEINAIYKGRKNIPRDEALQLVKRKIEAIKEFKENEVFKDIPLEEELDASVPANKMVEEEFSSAGTEIVDVKDEATGKMVSKKVDVSDVEEPTKTRKVKTPVLEFSNLSKLAKERNEDLRASVSPTNGISYEYRDANNILYTFPDLKSVQEFMGKGEEKTTKAKGPSKKVEKTANKVEEIKEKPKQEKAPVVEKAATAPVVEAKAESAEVAKKSTRRVVTSKKQTPAEIQDKKEARRQEVIKRAKEEAPELIEGFKPEELLKHIEDAKKLLKAKKKEEAKLDPISNDIDFVMLKNEGVPQPRPELMYEGAGDLIGTMFAKEAGGMYNIKPEGRSIGLSFLFNVQRDNVQRIEARTGIPFTRVFHRIQDGIRQEHLLSIPYLKRINAVTKGLRLSNSQRVYQLLEHKGLDERNMTYADMKHRNNVDPKIKNKFGYISEAEFNAAKEISNVLFEAGQEFGIPLDKMIKDYAPRIRAEGLEWDAAIKLWKQPEVFKWWAEEERSGYLRPHEEDIFKVARAYVTRGARKKAVGQHIEAMTQMYNNAMKTGNRVLSVPEQQSINKILNDTRGYPTALDKALDISAEATARIINSMLDKASLGMLPKRYENVRYLEKQSKDKDHMVWQEVGKDPGFLKVDDIASRLINLHLSLTYAGALGLRPVAVIRNFLQPFMTTMPIVGPKALMKGIAKALTKEGMEEAKAKGVLLDDYLPLGGELEAVATNMVEEAASKTMWAYLKTDDVNRAVSFHSMKALIDEHKGDFVRKLEEGKDVYAIKKARDKFFDDAEINFFHSALIENELMPHLRKGDFEKFSDTAAKHMADETQWVYRRANAPVFMQGKVGRLLGQFGTWPVWYLYYTKNVLKRGSPTQRAKRVAGIIATNYMIQEIGEKAFGVDLGKWVWWHPMYWTGGIAASMIRSGFTGLTATLDDKNYEAAKAQSEFKNALSLHAPASLAVQSVIRAQEEIRQEDQIKRAMGFTPSY